MSRRFRGARWKPRELSATALKTWEAALSFVPFRRKMFFANRLGSSTKFPMKSGIPSRASVWNVYCGFNLNSLRGISIKSIVQNKPCCNSFVLSFSIPAIGFCYHWSRYSHALIPPFHRVSSFVPLETFDSYDLSLLSSTVHCSSVKFSFDDQNVAFCVRHWRTRGEKESTSTLCMLFHWKKLWSFTWRKKSVNSKWDFVETNNI